LDVKILGKSNGSLQQEQSKTPLILFEVFCYHPTSMITLRFTNPSLRIPKFVSSSSPPRPEIRSTGAAVFAINTQYRDNTATAPSAPVEDGSTLLRHKDLPEVVYQQLYAKERESARL